MEIAFGFSILQIGLLVAGGYVINMVFQPLVRRLTQRCDPGMLMVAGISLIAGSIFIFLVSGSFASMLISILVPRLGSRHGFSPYAFAKCRKRTPYLRPGTLKGIFSGT